MPGVWLFFTFLNCETRLILRLGFMLELISVLVRSRFTRLCKGPSKSHCFTQRTAVLAIDLCHKKFKKIFEDIIHILKKIKYYYYIFFYLVFFLLLFSWFYLVLLSFSWYQCYYQHTSTGLLVSGMRNVF